EPATWHGGVWDGRSGTAARIEFQEDTELFWRAEEVTFTFDHGKLPRFYSKNWGKWAEVSDYFVPVMKREPHALTLFFSNDEENLGVLEELPKQIKAGTLTVVPHAR